MGMENPTSVFQHRARSRRRDTTKEAAEPYQLGGGDPTYTAGAPSYREGAPGASHAIRRLCNVQPGHTYHPAKP